MALTVLGQTVNAVVDTGCSNSTMSTDAVAQMHLQQLMDRGEKLASYVQGYVKLN